MLLVCALSSGEGGGEIDLAVESSAFTDGTRLIDFTGDGVKATVPSEVVALKLNAPLLLSVLETESSLASAISSGGGVEALILSLEWFSSSKT